MLIEELETNLDTLTDGFCGLTLFTHPKTKKGAPKIGKISRLVVQLCGYESAVNRRINKENESRGLKGVPPFCAFRAESLWNGKGKHITKHVVEHTETGKRYLAYMPLRVVEETWLADGVPVEKEEIVCWLVGSSPSKRQPQEKVVHWRVVDLENILEIKQG